MFTPGRTLVFCLYIKKIAAFTITFLIFCFWLTIIYYNLDMRDLLYLCDLFTTKNKILLTTKNSEIKGINVIDFTKLKLDTINPLNLLKNKVIQEIKKLKKPTTLIIDSFSAFIVSSIYKDGFDFKNIKKFIIINPYGKSFYFKIFTIKNIWLPKNSRTMIYKKMYLLNNLSNFSDDNLFVKDMRNEMNYLKENEHKVNLILNQILNFKSLNTYFEFLNNKKIVLVYGDKNKIYTKKDIAFFNSFDKKYIIKDSCYYHFWEKPNKIIKILSELY